MKRLRKKSISPQLFYTNPFYFFYHRTESIKLRAQLSKVQRELEALQKTHFCDDNSTQQLNNTMSDLHEELAEMRQRAT